MNQEEIDSLVNLYYKRIGVEKSNKGREHKDYKPRAAIMVALSDVCTCTAIGRYFGRRHCSVLYAKKRHEMNMQFWEGYADLYYAAKSMMGGVKTEARLEDLNAYLRDFLNVNATSREEIISLVKRSLSSVG